MTVLYLTNNSQLAGTARILVSWLTLGRRAGIGACVALQRRGQLSDWLQAHDIPYVESPMPWMRMPWPVPGILEARRMARWGRANGVTIVHCNEHDVYPFGVLVARLLRVPIVCHVRFKIDAQFAQWAFGGWRRPGALLWTTAQQREDSASANGVVPDSRQHLIPLGPDPERFRFDPTVRTEARRRFDIRDGEVAIGAATALRPVKRIGDFIDLVAELANRHPHVVGLLAGGAVPEEAAYARAIESRIAATGLGRRLRWFGHLEPIEPFLSGLDVFVSTSEYETFGNSVAEAMACRVPVVGYVGGSVHEIIGDAGIVVPDGDLAGLSGAVNTLVADRTVRDRFAELGGQRVAKTFDPVVSFQKLRQVYAGLIGSPGHSPTH